MKKVLFIMSFFALIATTIVSCETEELATNEQATEKDCQANPNAPGCPTDDDNGEG